MKKLLQTALSERVNRRILVFIVFLMCLLTMASQLEIFALGMITKKGPNFFELFAPIQERKTSTGRSHYPARGARALGSD